MWHIVCLTHLILWVVIYQMVFGWGKKKEVEEQEPISDSVVQPVEQEIPLDNISAVIDDLKNLRSKTLVAEASSFKNKIAPHLDELNSIAIALEKDNLKVDDIDKHLRTIVERGKKQVISTIKQETSMKISEVKSLDDVFEISNTISRALKRMGDVLGRQSRVIHLFAKKYAEKLKVILAELNTEKESIQYLINNYKKFENDAVEILDNLEKITKSKETLEKKLNRISYFEKSVQELEQKIQKITLEIKEKQSSSEYKKYLEIQEQINRLEPERHNIKRHFNDQFTKISRPLGKYEYVSSLDREQKTLLSQLVSNPFESISEEKKNDIIVILQSVRKGVISGSVSVKDVDKSVQFLDETTELLDDLIKKKSDFNSKEKQLTENLKVFDYDGLSEKTTKLQKTTQNLDELNSKIDLFKSEIAEAQNLGPRLTMTIEQKLREVSSTKYVIKD